MSSMWIVVMTLISVSLCVLGVITLVIDMFFRDHLRVRERLQAAFSEEIRERAQQSPLFKDLQLAEPDEQLASNTLWHRMQTLIDQAGLPWTPLLVVGITVVSVCVAFSVTLLFTRSTLLASLAAAAVLPLPMAYVWRRREQRRARLCAQLPDAFDVMSRALRAGQSVSGAFQVIANDFPSPIKDEFQYCYEQQHLGIAPEVALRDLARRSGVMELQIFVVAMIVNLRVGGNLSELLTKLSGILRRRANIAGRVKALTGEGRLQAVVLTALPTIVFIALYILNRDYAQILVDRPWLLAGCLGSQGLGGLCIHRLTQIDY
jgi:tight adherence protein B